MNSTEQRTHKTALSAFATAAGERCDGIDARIAALDEGLSERIDGVEITLAEGDVGVRKMLTNYINAKIAVEVDAATEPLRRNFWGRLLWAFGIR